MDAQAQPNVIELPQKSKHQQLLDMRRILEIRLTMVNNAIELFENDKDFEKKLNTIEAIGGRPPMTQEAQ